MSGEGIRTRPFAFHWRPSAQNTHGESGVVRLTWPPVARPSRNSPSRTRGEGRSRRACTGTSARNVYTYSLEMWYRAVRHTAGAQLGMPNMHARAWDVSVSRVCCIYAGRRLAERAPPFPCARLSAAKGPHCMCGLGLGTAAGGSTNKLGGCVRTGPLPPSVRRALRAAGRKRGVARRFPHSVDDTNR